MFGPRLVFESAFSVMDGQTNYTYQPDTDPNAIRFVDFTLGTQDFTAPRHEEQPNSRHQFDNTVAYNVTGFGGDHFLKTGVQWARLYFEQRYTVQGHHYVEYSNGAAQPHSPVQHADGQQERGQGARVLLPGRLVGQLATDVEPRLPHSTTTRASCRSSRTRTCSSTSSRRRASKPTAPGPISSRGSGIEGEVLNQTKGVWRAGAVYDLFGDGRTAIKANYSRYALQVGIDRVTAVNPLTVGSQDLPVDRSERRRQVPGDRRSTLSQCGAFSGGLNTFYAADGIDWPYSDEVTAGIERQIGGSMRVGAMFYYRTNRDQLGTRNEALPTSAYTPFTINVPNGPNGATTATVYNLAPALDQREQPGPRQPAGARHRLQGRRVHRVQALLAATGRWWPD